MQSVDFLFKIDKNSQLTITKQIYEYIKTEILNGKFKQKDKLPSIRKAVESFHASKTCVISAYLQLVTEGFIQNIPQKGYYVCKINSVVEQKFNHDLQFKEQNISYINDSIDKNSFSRALWKKYYNNILLDKSIDLTNLGDEQGEYETRVAIANFARTHRGLKCTPEQVVVGAGIQTLIEMLIKITKNDYPNVMIEEPGYKKVEYVFEDFDYPIKKLKVLDDGVDLDDLKNVKNALIYVSPSYQYPLGKLMTVDKRLELIRHAKENNCIIIEDDYASTIRFKANPISSLQGLDTFLNTVYLGSFSKTFLPSLRISFMVIPPKFLDKYYSIKSKYTHTCSKVEQLALAKFIQDGQMERHLKRINNIYKQKNAIISNYIKTNYNSKLKIVNSESGFHMILKCKTGKRDFLKDFDNEFLKISVISQTETELLFLFGYSGLENEEIPEVIDKIVEVLA